MPFDTGIVACFYVHFVVNRNGRVYFPYWLILSITTNFIEGVYYLQSSYCLKAFAVMLWLVSSSGYCKEKDY